MSAGFYIRFDKAGRTVRFDRLTIRLKGQDVQHLTLEEFAEHLRVSGAGDEPRWGDAILELNAQVEAAEDDATVAESNAADATEKLEAITEAIATHVPLYLGADTDDHAATIERAGNLLADIRVVLVERGALAADDTTTDIPALIGALLS